MREEHRVILKCVNRDVLVQKHACSVVAVELTVSLIQLSEETVHIGVRYVVNLTLCGRDTDVHVCLLNRGKHRNQIVPGIRNGQAEFVQNIRAVEHQVVVLRLRHTVDTLMSARVGILIRNIGGRHEFGEAFFEALDIRAVALKLRQVDRGASQRIVDRLSGRHIQRDVGSRLRHSCRKQYRCRHQVYVDADVILGNKRVIDHRLQDGTLVATGENPDRDRLHVIAVVNITDCVVIHNKGSKEGANLVRKLVKPADIILRNLVIAAAYDEVVDIQIGFAHGKDRATKGTYVVLESTETDRNLIGVINETLKLGCKGKKGRYLRTGLTGVFHQLIYNMVENLILGLHTLDNVRIFLIDIVVAVRIRFGTGVNQDATIHLIQTIDGVRHLGKNVADAAERNLETNRILSGLQFEEIRVTVLVGEFCKIPVIVEVELDGRHFFKRNLTVDIEGTARYKATGIVLPCLQRQFVEAFVRNVYFILNPLAGNFPVLAAAHVDDLLLNIIGIGSRRAAVIRRIEGLRRPCGRILSLNSLFPVGFCGRQILSTDVICVLRRILHRRKNE